MQVEGKVALVTGATRGIGAATALELARRGAHIAAVARHDDDSAREVGRQVESLGRRWLMVPADLGRPDDATGAVRQAVAGLGPVAALVHSAGGLIEGGLFDVDPPAWQAAFDVHVHALYYLCRAAIPDMKQQGEGAIVMVSSVAGLRGVHMNLAYQVVKGALPQFARALAREVADHNIRVNCVAPGIIRTRFHQGMTARQKQHNLDHRIPLHREGTPQQVATLIAELVTNDYITGETFTVDGGLTMRIA
jgi:NAD(P)-dependent dehydrogenase (short-subunit alcohol dehydrogenase family)